MVNDTVILVNTEDAQTGVCEKIDAHVRGLLHRAISVFIINSNGELLLQRRNPIKYHSGGLWTNTCCSHPKPNEDAKQAAIRRLYEEMGISCSDLHFAFKFHYKIALDNDYIEHEIDHVFIGKTNDLPKPDKNEVIEWKYESFETIENDLQLHPQDYTYWFKLIFKDVQTSIKQLI